MTDEDLDSAIARYRSAREAFDAYTRELGDDLPAIDEVTDAYRRAIGLLDAYEDRATGSGDFKGYVEFRQRFDRLVEVLADDLPHRDAFEAAQAAVDHRRLNERHFTEARNALSPVEDLIETNRARTDARSRLRDARHELVEHRERLQARCDSLAQLASLDPDAIDADVTTLSEPVESYNSAIEEDFATFLRETPSRELLGTYHRLRHFSLLDIEQPPDDLVAFLSEHPVGHEPVPVILEYLDYSRSKLAHYVDDPGRFHGELRPDAPYLESLSAEPFRLDWPPPEASQFRWYLRELRQAVDRFATESTVATLRAIETVCRDSDRYSVLRSAAVLQHDLTPAERELVQSRDVEDELTDVQQAIDRIDTLLD